jgi:hypothetical protein
MMRTFFRGESPFEKKIKKGVYRTQVPNFSAQDGVGLQLDCINWGLLVCVARMRESGFAAVKKKRTVSEMNTIRHTHFCWNCLSLAPPRGHVNKPIRPVRRAAGNFKVMRR